MSPELAFRKELAAAMRGAWHLTWHEDREINPGVPDLSYVMPGTGYETGWIELKATLLTKKLKFEVEPSQHFWMDDHAGKIPVHFLLANPKHVWLVDAIHHRRLHEITEEELNSISQLMVPRESGAIHLRTILSFHLRSATSRGRDGVSNLQGSQTGNHNQENAGPDPRTGGGL